MAYKKTCWYTVIAPLRIGVICGSPTGAGAPFDDELVPLIELGHLAGIAFQISDDLLNLEADEDLYGKETRGRPVGRQANGDVAPFRPHSVAGSCARAPSAFCETPRSEKRPSDVAWMLEAMTDAGSLEHGRRVAEEYSGGPSRSTRAALTFHDNDDRRFLREMLRYVIDRLK